MKHIISILLVSFNVFVMRAQVGINTTSPHASAALDIESGATPRGLLAPRMTTAQRLAITTPAESLLVFDTTEKAFYFYNTANVSWVKMSNANESAGKRTNYKLVKSVADLAPELAAGGNSRYLLSANAYYEINGTVTLAYPIELNNAYVSGLDANEDVLMRPGGVIFSGNAGGSIRNVTLSNSAQAFNISTDATQSLLIQNTIVRNMSTRVGAVSGVGLFFGNIVQFLDNNNGIAYSNIGNLLLSNQAWFANNSGTYETFSGTFGFIQKSSGFSTVAGSAVAIDVSSNPATGSGVIYGTVFSGATSSPLGIIKRYTTGSYEGYSFTNNWYVDAPGIPREGDSEATGDINLSVALGNDGATTSFTGTTPNVQKIKGTTTSSNLFRFSKVNDNRIVYDGNKKRYFQVTAAISYQGENSLQLVAFIAKNGVRIPQIKTYGSGTTGFLTTSGIIALPLTGIVEMNKNDYIEIWVERIGGSGNMQTVSLNLTAR